MANPISSGAPIWPRPIRQLLRPLATSAVGMSTQQHFIETISANIANAETTRTPEGGPYRRRVATVQANAATGGVTAQVVEDRSPGRLVYDPGHPDADQSGYVRMPNVDVATEMVDLMVARRMHEANASVFQAAKGMLRRALDI
ncbi:MAG TPA: flagellar basal body rod protein FlgC [Gemmatimonadales bacterium]|nr:flagellar basal body rod protein FlgC [Gemmatimonadales bacterium]